MSASHDPEFKASAIPMVKQHGRRVSEVAKNLGISESCPRGWIKQHDAAGAPAEERCMRAELVTEALSKAICQRKPGPGLIFHSDRGVQFASEAVREVCRDSGICRSMSGKGDCCDDAVAESFFGRMRLKN